MTDLVRFGVSIGEKLLERFDSHIVQKKGYANRSEAIRDLIRNQLVESEWESEEEVAGTITLIYDHHVRGLSETLLETQHDYHHLILSNMHLHLDHHNCLEVLAVKGIANEVRPLAERLISTKGVKHGRLTITSTGKHLG